MSSKLFVLIVIGVISWAIVKVNDLASEVRDATELARSASAQFAALAEQVRVVTYVASWVDKDGILREVRTARLEGETPEAHRARHAQEVADMKALYPPKQP